MIGRYLKCDEPFCTSETGPIDEDLSEAQIAYAATLLGWECEEDRYICPKCVAERSKAYKRFCEELS